MSRLPEFASMRIGINDFENQLRSGGLRLEKAGECFIRHDSERHLCDNVNICKIQ